MEPTAVSTTLASLHLVNERRIFERIEARLRLSYRYLHVQSPSSSLTLDVSAVGISLLTESKLPKGLVIEIDIQFPFRERPVHLIGQVVWSEPLVLGRGKGIIRIYETGARFLDIDPDSQALLAQYLR